MKSSRSFVGLSVGVLAFGGAEVKKGKVVQGHRRDLCFSVECALGGGIIKQEVGGRQGDGTGRGCKPRSRSVRGVRPGISACGSMA